MQYIYRQEDKDLYFNGEDLIEMIGGEEKDKINDEFINDFNNNFYEIISNSECNFCKSNQKMLNDIKLKIIDKFKLKTEIIRNDVINKYLLSENLHILMSNGCSLYSGSLPINPKNSNKHSELLRDFKLNKNYKTINEVINNLAEERPEYALDKLYEIHSFYENIIKNNNIISKITKLLYEYKKSFIENCVLNIDYSNNVYHKIFLKRITSRNPRLRKVNIFTLNYDLLIEKTAEELGINTVNGFSGFHFRSFMPSSFSLDMHIKSSNGGKAYSNSINLFKLHGSLSWKFDENKPPYGITEIQKDFNKIKSFEELPDCIIYPVQSKKKHSLDLPYSEMFRQFVENLNKSDSTLLVFGYSFLDEHVNDIITNSLSNPNFSLVIFSYQKKDDKNISPYLRGLFERSQDDSRITIFSGKVLGNFEYIVKYLIPYPFENDSERVIYDTFQKLKGEE